ncbi:hypothetical protein LSTR_LSTR010776 [Laodelphax striatellus]|uniref:Uncharacterized protein n=1 Tax=Laodelphax striatellus TaxID=195883 RepID=A0A482XCW0_LAOST|nr:hypothetical protein LSTR_LSTR010776 [Laodelphax striatellus]
MFMAPGFTMVQEATILLVKSVQRWKVCGEDLKWTDFDAVCAKRLENDEVNVDDDDDDDEEELSINDVILVGDDGNDDWSKDSYSRKCADDAEYDSVEEEEQILRKYTADQNRTRIRSHSDGKRKRFNHEPPMSQRRWVDCSNQVPTSATSNPDQMRMHNLHLRDRSKIKRKIRVDEEEEMREELERERQKIKKLKREEEEEKSQSAPGAMIVDVQDLKKKQIQAALQLKKKFDEIRREKRRQPSKSAETETEEP